MKGICKVILRIIAILIFLKGFSYIHGIILYFITKSQISSPNVTLDIAFFLISLSGVIVLAILIWAFSGKISSKMVTDLDDRIELTTDTLLRTAIIAIGVLILADTLPSLIGNLYEYISAQSIIKDQTTSHGYNGFLQVKAGILTDFLKSVIALFMVVGYRSIIKLSNMLSIKKIDADEDYSNEDI